MAMVCDKYESFVIINDEVTGKEITVQICIQSIAKITSPGLYAISKVKIVRSYQECHFI
jgi:hypothetical protein